MTEVKHFMYSLLAIFVIVSVVTAVVQTGNAMTGNAFRDYFRLPRYQVVDRPIFQQPLLVATQNATLQLNQPITYRGRTITLIEALPRGRRNEFIGSTIRVNYCGLVKDEYITVIEGTHGGYVNVLGVEIDVTSVPNAQSTVVSLRPATFVINLLAMGQDQNLQSNLVYSIPGTNNLLVTKSIRDAQATVYICSGS